VLIRNLPAPLIHVPTGHQLNTSPNPRVTTTRLWGICRCVNSSFSHPRMISLGFNHPRMISLGFDRVPCRVRWPPCTVFSYLVAPPIRVVVVFPGTPVELFLVEGVVEREVVLAVIADAPPVERVGRFVSSFSVLTRPLSRPFCLRG